MNIVRDLQFVEISVLEGLAVHPVGKNGR